MKWSDDETHQFVKMYLSYECLWNPAHPNYRVKGKRLKAYRDISAALNDTTGILLNETEVQIKLKSLRSTYSQELSKIKHRSSPKWTYTPNMKWFGEWHKCYSGLKKPTEDSSFASKQDLEEPCPKIWLSQNEDNLQVETLDPFPETDEEYNIILKPEPREVPHVNIESSFSHTAYSDSSYESKRRKKKHRSPSLDCFRSSTDSNTDRGEKDDEFDIYGRYIASQLRKMDLEKALRLQLKIQSLVSEARITDLNIK